jgi:isoleucyl-tRNA synthetase
VHLGEFPQVDETLIDADLSADMDALLRLVSLGSAARNTVKIKVRQPLAELTVQPANDSERYAIERFAGQMSEELNIKKISLHDPSRGPLLNFEVKPNAKNLGPKFGPRLKEIQGALARANLAQIVEKIQAGSSFELPLPDGPVTLEPTDVYVMPKVPEGWTGIADRGTQLLLDARLTEALKLEGIARDITRQIQELRKKSGLEMEDRIELYLGTDSDLLRKAIEVHREYIANETLTVRWSDRPLTCEGVFTAHVKVDGQALTIQLRRVGEP